MNIIEQTEDFQLLRRFVEDGSQEAFGQLMKRYLNFVYSVCRREAGEAALAEDMTQAVFLILAQKAASIRADTVMAGWFFQTARFVARNALRQEARRKAGEQKVIEEMAQKAEVAAAGSDVWQSIEPLLHGGIDGLGKKDCEALLLRHFEGKSFKEVGGVLGISEDTARKRVERAIEKLKTYLRKNGVPVSAAILATLLSERAVQAAPRMSVALVAQLAANITGTGASAGGTGLAGTKAISISQGVLKSMLINKIQVATMVAGLALAGTGGGILAARSAAIGGAATGGVGTQPAVTAPAVAPAKAPPERKQFRVMIDAGHGGVDTGVKASSLVEKDVTLKLALALKDKLQRQRIEVLMTRTSDKFLSLHDRARMVREASPNCFISLHCEDPRFASRSSELSYNRLSSRGLAALLSSDISKNLSSDVKASKPVVRQRNFYVLREVPGPAIMINGDIKLFSDSQSLLVNAIVNGVKHFAEGGLQK